MTIKYVSSKLVAELTLAPIKGGIIVRHSIFKGSHYEAGYVYGKELSLQRIMLGEMYKRSEDKERSVFATECAAICKEIYPTLLEEMRGIADGQNIEVEILHEFLFCMYAFPIDVRCSCFAFRKKGEVIFGRNSDFLTALEEFYDAAFYNLNDSIPFVGNTTACVQMEDGINAYGLAIGLTFIYPTVRKPGLNAGLLVRYILEHCKCVEEAKEVLLRLPIASGQTLTMADRSGSMCVAECNCETIEFIDPQGETGFVVSTKQFISEKMKKYNVIGIDDMMSLKRYEDTYAALQKEETYSLEYAMDILKGKYGFICQYDRSLGGDTVWSSIYDISKQTVYRAEGNPMRSPYEIDSRLAFKK